MRRSDFLCFGSPEIESPFASRHTRVPRPCRFHCTRLRWGRVRVDGAVLGPQVSWVAPSPALQAFPAVPGPACACTAPRGRDTAPRTGRPLSTSPTGGPAITWEAVVYRGNAGQINCASPIRTKSYTELLMHVSVTPHGSPALPEAGALGV